MATRKPDPAAKDPVPKDPVPKDPTLELERACFAAGALLVIGVDEVGRGAIAGPVAVGAHAIAAGTEDFPAGLRDSKLLSEKRREAIAPAVAQWGVGTVGYASPEEIDAHGITWALGRAGVRALQRLRDAGLPLDRAVVLLDGAHDWLTPALRSTAPGGDPVQPGEVRTRVGADRACAVVAAASVDAKVARDALMRAADAAEPGYGWASNKGYGAPAHYAGLAELGPSPQHRRTWLPGSDAPERARR